MVKTPSQIQDLYQRLGLNRDATPEMIKRAFRSLALRWHPDRNQGSHESHIEFIAVSEAYEVLSDAQKRTVYDTTQRVDSYRMRQGTQTQQTGAPQEAREDFEYSDFEFYQEIFRGVYQNLFSEDNKRKGKIITHLGLDELTNKDSNSGRIIIPSNSYDFVDKIRGGINLEILLRKSRKKGI